MWGDGGSYAAWTSYLERWGSRLQAIEEPLPALGQDYFDPDTWVRLEDHLIDAFNSRLRLWSTALTSALGEATDEFAVGRALVNARIGLLSVLGLADHPGLPGSLREQLRGLVERQIRFVQQSLEREVDRLSAEGWPRAQAEARRRTLRENPLTAVLSGGGQPATAARPAPFPTGATDPWAFDLTRPSRRHIALD